MDQPVTGTMEDLARYMAENGISLYSAEGQRLVEEYMLLSGSVPSFSYSILDFDGNGLLTDADHTYIVSMWNTTTDGTCTLENLYNRYRVTLQADD